MVIEPAGGDGYLPCSQKLRRTVFNGVFHDRLQGKRREMLVRQLVRNGERHLQARLETRLLDLEVRIHMLNLIGEGDDLRRPFQVFAEKGRQKLYQLRGLIAVAADHRFEGVERIKQEMRIDLGMQQFNF